MRLFSITTGMVVGLLAMAEAVKANLDSVRKEIGSVIKAAVFDMSGRSDQSGGKWDLDRLQYSREVMACVH
ncbi:MAG: hypothetical protein MK183_10250 [Verrucomicrobiales bacterium]|jgi:hypothetical protein|nr:hypothetical protein [Verrucomicrobiales bacterium]MED5586551.1 hypothetical protein [Verrucomicrobiota bacterium]